MKHDEATGAVAPPFEQGVGRLYPKRADWRHDVHAYECYTCQDRSSPAASTPECKGCISRHTRPHWRPHGDYVAAAQRVILMAGGKPPNA